MAAGTKVKYTKKKGERYGTLTIKYGPGDDVEIETKDEFIVCPWDEFVIPYESEVKEAIKELVYGTEDSDDEDEDDDD